MIGLSTESIEEYNSLIEKKHEHVVYVDRRKIPTTDTIKGTRKNFTIEGFHDYENIDNIKEWKLRSSDLQCSCCHCIMNNDKLCKYRSYRQVHDMYVKESYEYKMDESDITNFSKLTVAALRAELLRRSLNIQGKKKDLIERLKEDEEREKNMTYKDNDNDDEDQDNEYINDILDIEVNIDNDQEEILSTEDTLNAMITLIQDDEIYEDNKIEKDNQTHHDENDTVPSLDILPFDDIGDMTFDDDWQQIEI